MPVVGPVDLYPAVFRYLDPIAEYNEVWQIEANLRVRLTKPEGQLLPYIGGGIALQPAFAPLAGPNPEESIRSKVFSVLRAC